MPQDGLRAVFDLEDMEAVREEYEERIARLERQHAGDAAAVHASYAERIARLERQHAEDDAALRASYEERIAQLEREAIEAREARTDGDARVRDEAQRRADADIAALQAEYEERIARHTHELEQQRAEDAAAQRALVDAVEQARDEADQRTRSVREVFEERIAQLARRHDEDRVASAQARQALVDALERASAREPVAPAPPAVDVESLRAEYEQRITWLERQRAEAQAASEELRQTLVDAVERLRAREESDVRVREEVLRRVQVEAQLLMVRTRMERLGEEALTIRAILDAFVDPTPPTVVTVAETPATFEPVSVSATGAPR